MIDVYVSAILFLSLVKLDLIVATCYVQSVTEIQIAFFLLFKEQFGGIKAIGKRETDNSPSGRNRLCHQPRPHPLVLSGAGSFHGIFPRFPGFHIWSATHEEILGHHENWIRKMFTLQEK